MMSFYVLKRYALVGFLGWVGGREGTRYCIIAAYWYHTSGVMGCLARWQLGN